MSPATPYASVETVGEVAIAAVEPLSSPTSIYANLCRASLTVAGAVKEPMSKIEGDGSALCYFRACLLEREFSDLGASWHGVNFYQGTVVAEPLDTNPLIYSRPSFFERWRRLLAGRPVEPTPPPEPWKILGELPTSYLPEVDLGPPVTVTYFAYKRYCGERILRYRAYFSGNGYALKSDREELAIGPNLIVV